MATIKRTSASVPVPVERAQLVSPADFPFSTTGAESLKEIGGVLTELSKRRAAAQDSLAISDMNRIQQTTKAKMKDFVSQNPDPDLWTAERERLLTEQSKQIGQLKASGQTTERMKISQKGFEDTFRLDNEILQTTETVKIDIEATGADLITAIANNDGSPEAEQAERESRDAHEAALLRGEAPEIAAIRLVETLKEGRKAFFENQSKLFPDKTIKEMQAKKKALGAKGEDEDGLNAKDYDAIIGSAIIAKNQIKQISDETNREAKLALYTKEDDGEVLTREDYNKAWRDPERADQHYDEYVTGQEAEQRGEANFVKKGDPIILARTEAVIDLAPMSITEEQLYENSTSGIGTENITGLVDRLRKAKEGFYAPITKYNTQFSTLLNAKYFGEKDEIETSTRYLEMKRKMSEFLGSQKPNEAVADAFFAGLITKNFAGFRRGGWEEKGFKHKYVDEEGAEIIGFFRFGDIRTRKVDEKTVNEFYAGTDDDGDALWLPRR